MRAVDWRGEDMSKRFFGGCIAMGLLGGAVINTSIAETSEGKVSVQPVLEEVAAPVYSIIAPAATDIIGHLLEDIQKYAKSAPSINAQNLYDYIKTLRFEAKTKQEINACNTLMSYFRVQSNSQSGDTIRKKLSDLSEAMVWLERKKAGRPTSDNITDFRIVQYLLGGEVFPHLTLNKMKVVLDAAQAYKDKAAQAAFMDNLVNQHGTVDLHVLDGHLLEENHQIYDHFQALSVPIQVSHLDTDQLDAEIINQQNQLNQLKRGTYKLNGKEHTYTKTMQKHLVYIISNRLAALILRKNTLSKQ